MREDEQVWSEEEIRVASRRLSVQQSLWRLDDSPRPQGIFPIICFPEILEMTRRYQVLFCVRTRAYRRLFRIFPTTQKNSFSCGINIPTFLPLLKREKKIYIYVYTRELLLSDVVQKNTNRQKNITFFVDTIKKEVTTIVN